MISSTSRSRAKAPRAKRRRIRTARLELTHQKEHTMTPITYRSTDVNGLKVFYRESGPSDAPKLLLLHGYPSAGHMFRDLIPQLADRFHVVAPDLLGFGQSDMPSRDSFTYTFDALTGFRLAVRRPERITAIVTQNGNAYEEGLSDGWNPIRAYWTEPTQANRD